MKFKTVVDKLKSTVNTAQLAVLIDPDKFNPALILMANKLKVSCFLVGGSRLESGSIEKTVDTIKRISKLPVILFPGDENQLTALADGLFLPSLLSGRNPDYLIGKHILMAPKIKAMKLKSIPMAYLLINSSNESATRHVTQTQPMDAGETRLINHTVLAAQQLGFKAIYLEAGSGANYTVPAALIKSVKATVSLPVIVGGGINSKAKALKAIKAGANMVVVGNALEKDMYLLTEISSCF